MTSHSRTHAEESPDPDVALPDKVRRGRTSRWRFTQTPQWVLLMAELSDPGYRIYSLLLAHVNITDDDGEVWPQQQTMAEMLDRHRNSISRVITKELVPLGLVDVEVERYGTNNSRRRNIYTVHELPPDGFDGWASIAEWYAAHPRPEPAPTNRRDRKNAGHPGRTKNSASGRTTDGASTRTKNSAVTRRRKNKTKEETSSPLPPSFQRGSDVAEVGKEEEISTQPKNAPKILDRAQKLVDDAVRLWPRHHKAPSARDHQRLSERVAVELENGGDETVIVHELSRDMQDAGQAMRVIMGDRTTVPGWGRVADPRPDHAQYEISNPGHPWCGRCDERTRLIGVYDPTTGKTLPGRCRTPVVDHRGETVACNPRTTPSLPDDIRFDNEGQEEELSPDEFAAMSKASLENPKASRSELLAAARAKMAEGSEKVKAGKGGR